MSHPTSAPGRRSVPAGLAVLVIAVLLAACTASPTSGGKPAGTSGAPPRPVPIPLAGTTPTGTLSFLGSVMRVTFDALPAGRVTPINPVPATLASGETAPVPGTLPSVTIGYRQFGTGPELLLVNGQDGTLSWWSTSFLQQLAPHFRVTIFDLPGVGYSGPDGRAAPSVDSYADVTAGLVLALGLSKPAVLGWGMGGGVALELALRHPGLVSRLVLVDTSAGGPASTPTGPVTAATLASPTASVRTLAPLLFPADQARAELDWLRTMALEPPDDIVAATVASEAAVEKAWWAAGAPAGLLRRLELPVLVVCGRQDAVFPPRDSTQLVEDLPRAGELRLGDAGYGAIFQPGTTFLVALDRFAGPL